MNRYLLTIPYSYLRYGNYTCTVYAASEEDALELASDFNYHNSEEYDDGENDSSMDFEYDETQVELEEEDANEPDENSAATIEKIPAYFLEEINLI